MRQFWHFFMVSGLLAVVFPTAEKLDVVLPSGSTLHKNKQAIENGLVQNLAYQTMLSAARKVRQDACYVCSLIPADVEGSVPLIAVPLNSSEVLGAIIALTSTHDNYVVSGKDISPKLNLINESATNFTGYRIRLRNVSMVEEKITRPLFQTYPTKFKSQVCFTQSCVPGKRYLGTSVYCSQTVHATCNWQAAEREFCRGWFDGNPVPYIAQLNISIPLKKGKSHVTNAVLTIPNSDGFGSLQHHIWKCGQNVYQILPPAWCGVCHMAKLLPNMRIIDNLTYFHTHHSHYYPSGMPVQGVNRRKREVKVRISAGKKFAAGLLPWYGTVANGHEIDTIAMDLENITAMMVEGFVALQPEIKALRSMTLQNRMALDYILATQGGVCHVIGRECCTFIPDQSDNITDVVDHLNDLLHSQRLRDSSDPEGINWWAWMTGGNWWNVLLKWIMPVIGIFCSFILFLCCVLPFIRAMVSKIINTAIGNYVLIQENRSGEIGLSELPMYYDSSDTE